MNNYFIHHIKMDKRLLVKIIIAISVSALLIGGIVAGIVLSRSPKKCIDGEIMVHDR